MSKDTQLELYQRDLQKEVQKNKELTKILKEDKN